MAAGTVTPHFSRTFEAYDAQGGIHRLTMSYVKISANSWRAEVYAAPGETTAAGNLLVAGTVAFNGDGTLDVPSSSAALRSEEHTSELQSLMRISYAVFCLKKKTDIKQQTYN